MFSHLFAPLKEQQHTNTDATMSASEKLRSSLYEARFLVLSALLVALILIGSFFALPVVHNTNDTNTQTSSRTINDRVLADYASKVGTLNQYELGMYSGCEIVSLTLVLNSMGIDIDAYTIAETYLPYMPSMAGQGQTSPQSENRASEPRETYNETPGDDDESKPDPAPETKPEAEPEESLNNTPSDEGEKHLGNASSEIKEYLNDTSSDDAEQESNSEPDEQDEQDGAYYQTNYQNEYHGTTETGNGLVAPRSSSQERVPSDYAGTYESFKVDKYALYNEYSSNDYVTDFNDFSNGFENSFTQLASTYYLGDPYSVGTGYPPVIAKTAQAILDDYEITSLKAYDITDTELEDLYAFIDDGYPVLVWTTTYYEWPIMWNTPAEGLVMYDNAHCVVLVSYDTEAQTVRLSDPMLGFVDIDETQFNEIYETLGKMAVVIC